MHTGIQTGNPRDSMIEKVFFRGVFFKLTAKGM